MRLTTAGSVPRFDHSLLVEAVPALREEWAALRFGADGAVINPISGESVDVLRLLEGRHRSPGARYETVTRTPVTGVDPDRQQSLEAELLGGHEPDWTEYGRRLAELSEPTGEVVTTTSQFTLRADDSRAIAVTLADPSTLWSVDVEIVHGRIPTVAVEGRADATAMMVAEDVPGWLARRVGGEAAGSATLDLATIERRTPGNLAEASGQLRLMRGSASATVTPTPSTWDVTASVDLAGRGLGRLALRLFGGRLRRSFDTSAAAYWRSLPETVAAGTQALADLQRVIDGEGGMGPVVHRVLWDPTFDAHVATTYGLE